MKQQRHNKKNCQTRQSQQTVKTEVSSSYSHRQHAKDDTPMEIDRNPEIQEQIRYHETEIHHLKTALEIHDNKSGSAAKLQETTFLEQNSQPEPDFETIGPRNPKNPSNLPYIDFSVGTEKPNSFSSQSQLCSDSLGSQGNNYVPMDNVSQTCTGYNTEKNHTNYHNTSFTDNQYDDNSLYADDAQTNLGGAEIQKTSTSAEKGWEMNFYIFY